MQVSESDSAESILELFSSAFSHWKDSHELYVYAFDILVYSTVRLNQHDSVLISSRLEQIHFIYTHFHTLH